MDDPGYAVGLDTRITTELADEGLAREMVHRIQNLRKSAGFDISDRIVVYYAGWERLHDVFSRHGDYVREETLADGLQETAPPPDASTEAQKIDGHDITLAVRRLYINQCGLG
jgi:isoleucyl-tRNA synthetase